MSKYTERLEKNKPNTYNALALMFPSRYLEIIDIISKQAVEEEE